jgi:DNA-binding transcriptional LysR family regulator
MISWDRLRVFAAVAEHGSIAAAAAALHLTGPAVSQQLRKLEREAGCPLVEPDGRGIRLTPPGHLLATSARAAAALVADAERDLVNASGQVAGPLRIGAVASAVRVLLPDALRSLTAEHPRVEPRLRDGEIVDLIPALRARRLDVVVMESWSARPASVPPGVAVHPLLTEDVRLAVPERHRLAARESVRLAELEGLTWTACLPGTDQHGAVVQLLRGHNVDPDVRYWVYDYGTQLSLVAAGLAVSLVPRTARAPAPGVRFVPCVPPVSRSLAVATVAGGDTPAVRAFVGALLPVAARFHAAAGDERPAGSSVGSIEG